VGGEVAEQVRPADLTSGRVEVVIGSAGLLSGRRWDRRVATVRVLACASLGRARQWCGLVDPGRGGGVGDQESDVEDDGCGAVVLVSFC
jgi:hypothetical protein